LENRLVFEKENRKMLRVLGGLALVYDALEFACWDAWESLGAVEVARTIR